MANTTQNRIDQTRSELNTEIERLLPTDGNLKIADDLFVFRRSHPSELVHGESTLAFCIITQGSKRLFLGDEVYEYDQDHYLITAMQLPTVSNVVNATPDSPYLSVKLDLDPALVSSVLLASAQTTLAAEETTAFNVASIDADLLGAVLRLVKVSQQPDQAAYLAPLIKQEIVYRLLIGYQGGRLSHIAGLGPASQRISMALLKLREQFDQPLSIPAIAAESGMSVSSFHDHFKKATGLTPLQYQKHLRLREARRLLMSEDIDVANAGFQVGYNDASHFNRDYKKLFGQSPMRDIETLREAGPLALAAN